MSKIEIQEITYKNFGKCVLLSNGLIEVIITVDVGPRIIRYGFTNGNNILYEDINREIYRDNLTEFENGIWYLYGGHRLWAAPEALPRSYYPDNEPVSYEIQDNSIRFIPPAQKWTQIQQILTLTLEEKSSKLIISHEITNIGAWPITLAPWAVTVLCENGTEVIPMPQNDSGLLPNTKIALWPYAKMNDKRVIWGEKFIILKQLSEIPDNFKTGINSEQGFAMYFAEDNLFIKHFDVNKNGIYPDGGVSFESYSCPLYTEMETLSPLTEISSGESVSHREVWELYKENYPGDDENKLEEMVKKYVR